MKKVFALAMVLFLAFAAFAANSELKNDDDVIAAAFQVIEDQMYTYKDKVMAQVDEVEFGKTVF